MSDLTSMEDLHQTLLDRFDDLVAKRKTTTDPDMKGACLVEMDEVLHRIDLTQNLLLVAVTSELQNALKEVQTADAQVAVDIKQITVTAKFIQSLSDYLGYVDKAIDLAKQAALI
jgi:hypothetical protein